MAKAKPGRPLKFKDPVALQEAIDAYFGSCDPHIAKRKVKVPKADGSHYWAEEEYMTDQQPYTITGLALALDTNRYTLLNYQDPEHYPDDVPEDIREEFIDTITRAKAKCEAYNERLLLDPENRNSKGVTFNLTNNFGWKDKTEVEHKITDWSDLADEAEDDSDPDEGTSEEDSGAVQG